MQQEIFEKKMIEITDNVIVQHYWNSDTNVYSLQKDNGNFYNVKLNGDNVKESLNLLKRYVPNNLIFSMAQKNKKSIEIDTKIIFSLFQLKLNLNHQRMVKLCDVCDKYFGCNSVKILFSTKNIYFLCCDKCCDLFIIF